MISKEKFHTALLYLSHLVSMADGKIHEQEEKAIETIRRLEKISDKTYKKFQDNIQSLSEKQMYENGLATLSKCSHSEKLQVFIWLYKMSQADGLVDEKEVRFLLYAVENADLSFEEVVDTASRLPSVI